MMIKECLNLGMGFAHDVSCWLPNVAAWVRSGNVGSDVDKATLRWIFFQQFTFPWKSHSTNCSKFINHPIIDDI